MALTAGCRTDIAVTMKRTFVIGFALTSLALAGIAAPALAQQVQRIAAIVNDEVVSGFDVEQRIDMVIKSTRLRNTPETRRRLRQQVLRGLIDETLQLQAAQRNNISVSEEDLQRAYGVLERQNRLEAGRLADFLRANGLSQEALARQLRAEIAWSKLVRRRLQPSVSIGEDEVNEVLNRLQANADLPETRVSEILLPVDSPENEDVTLREAVRLVQQLRDGAPFGAVAREFSRGATANNGGEIGWVQPGQLAEELDRTVAALAVGAVSEPVRAAGGYYIIKLHERRSIAGDDPLETRLSLKQIRVPLPGGRTGPNAEAARDLTEQIMARAPGCDGLTTVAAEFEIKDAGDLGTVKLRELPEELRGAVADLPIGDFSKPIISSDAIMLLMVCEREVPVVEPPDRQKIEQELLRRRLAMLAQRYLRDLRRDAVVELR